MDTWFEYMHGSLACFEEELGNEICSTPEDVTLSEVDSRKCRHSVVAQCCVTSAKN